jgi:hypothetical protein
MREGLYTSVITVWLGSQKLGNSLSIALERNVAKNKTRASLVISAWEIKYLWFAPLRVDVR